MLSTMLLTGRHLARPSSRSDAPGFTSAPEPSAQPRQIHLCMIGTTFPTQCTFRKVPEPAGQSQAASHYFDLMVCSGTTYLRLCCAPMPTASDRTEAIWLLMNWSPTLSASSACSAGGRRVSTPDMPDVVRHSLSDADPAPRHSMADPRYGSGSPAKNFGGAGLPSISVTGRAIERNVHLSILLFYM